MMGCFYYFYYDLCQHAIWTSQVNKQLTSSWLSRNNMMCMQQAGSITKTYPKDRYIQFSLSRWDFKKVADVIGFVVKPMPGK